MFELLNLILIYSSLDMNVPRGSWCSRERKIDGSNERETDGLLCAKLIHGLLDLNSTCGTYIHLCRMQIALAEPIHVF